MLSLGRLCLLTVLGLILPTRGETQSHPESHSPHTTTREELLTDPGVPVHHEEEGTTTHSEKWSPQKDSRIMDPQTPKPPEGTTTRSEKWSPQKDSRIMDPQTPKPPGSSEDDPFFYDEATLRNRGLLVAAVLFITGIVILTSGKCRQWSRVCRNNCR
ncbi:FXYD domain-containing ion transport regulator 5 isoform X2 [Ochotona curzoniae]|uniref:FXYD domain-containing ion transport regulator 5 isoform X2 n=1 Tax=Ochotona curzoniae TaxID=130825 RepID=UPI001B350F8F|nr:FXYD domain-containing ion transport regulator 5 isoform X2 [Ochotona curzoniae]